MQRATGGLGLGCTGYLPIGSIVISSCLGLSYKIRNINHKKELITMVTMEPMGRWRVWGFRYLAPELTFSCDKPLP